MAYYAALLQVVETLEDISHGDDYLHYHPARQQTIKSIHHNFTSLRQQLDDYTSKDDERGNRFERRIRDLAFRAHHIIDPQCQPETNLFQRIFHRLTCARRDEEDLRLVEEEVGSISQDLVAINECHRREDLLLEEFYSAEDLDDEFDSISPTEANYPKQDIIPPPEDLDDDSHVMYAIGPIRPCPPPAPFYYGPTLVKFDDCKERIQDGLYTYSSRLEVISVTGIGSIGKTTLATNTYHDAVLRHYFDVCVWVTISQDYNIRKVLLDIASACKRINIDEIQESSDNEMKLHIYKYLVGRRYLVVLDDVWTIQVWEDIKRLLPDNSNRSRILLTSRLFEVANCASNVRFCYQLTFLSDSQSWDLLEKKVFGKEQCPPDLVAVGKSIASKCGGLPLAIDLIAGLLSNAKTLCDWRKIQRNVKSLLCKSNDLFFHIMTFSYCELPHRLKVCFLYIGVFSGDYEIRVSKLITLWAAEGFLKPSECKTVEQVGKDCLDELIKRNLLFVFKKNSNGEIKSCITHNLLREFCRRRAFDENFCHFGQVGEYDSGSMRVINSIYRVVISPQFPSSRMEVKRIGKYARSILCFGHNTSLARHFFVKRGRGFKQLRVLEAPGMKCTSFPDVILDMRYLKHLCFITTDCIPQLIFRLQELQSLNLSAYHVISLPSEIWKMHKLRHLMISRMILPPVPKLGDVFQNLQTLASVQDFEFTEEAIERIPNLRKLVVYTKGEPCHRWFCFSELSRLQQLEELKITFEGMSLDSMGVVSLPFSLKKMSLKGCSLLWKDLTVVGSLPNLQVLKLREGALVGEEWEPVEGEFVRLKFLLMKRLHLKYWRADEVHFPCLEQLQIEFCNELEEIPSAIGFIPTLQFIDIFGECSDGVTGSAIDILDEKRDYGNDVLQVRFDGAAMKCSVEEEGSCSNSTPDSSP